MTFSTWLRSRRPRSRRGKAQKLRQRKLFLEPLEDRMVLSTFQVTNTDDSGDGSLRQAIIDANALPGADTIKFKHSGEGTITLSSQLDITSDLTIDGPGANKSTVSGGGTTRVFHIAGGATVKIEELTVANGFVDGENGGGILNEGTLTLEDSVVSGNNALGAGGGIYDLGTLTIKESQVTDNYAYFGGGGIQGMYGTVTLDHAVISHNSGGFSGGGVGMRYGSLTVTDSTISYNSLPEASPGGGGVTCYNGEFTLRDSVVTGNTGAFGPIFLVGNQSNLISRSLISNNRDGGFGSGVGGIYDLFSYGLTRIEDSVISGNVGTGGAGGVFPSVPQ